MGCLSGLQITDQKLSHTSQTHAEYSSLWFITWLAWWFSGKELSCQCKRPGLGGSLEKEMAAHSSTLAWRIPWTEEPGGLQPRGGKELDMTERLNSYL